MNVDRIAARYGRALFLCAEEETTLVQIEKELVSLSTLFEESGSELRILLLNPAFSAEEQVSVLKEMATSFSLDPLTLNFLELLIEKSRIQYLPAITKSFSGEIDVRLQRVRAKVTSAKPLSDIELADVLEALRLRAGKNIIAQVEVDERAVMGLKAQIGGLVFDGTLSTMLDQFKRKLVAAPLEHS